MWNVFIPADLLTYLDSPGSCTGPLSALTTLELRGQFHHHSLLSALLVAAPELKTLRVGSSHIAYGKYLKQLRCSEADDPLMNSGLFHPEPPAEDLTRAISAIRNVKYSIDRGGYNEDQIAPYTTELVVLVADDDVDPRFEVCGVLTEIQRPRVIYLTVLINNIAQLQGAGSGDRYHLFRDGFLSPVFPNFASGHYSSLNSSRQQI